MSRVIVTTSLAVLLICPPGHTQVQNRQFTANSGEAGAGWADLDPSRTSDVTMTQKNNPASFFVKPPNNTHTQTSAQRSYQNNFRNSVLSTVTSMPLLEAGSSPVMLERSTPVQDVGENGQLLFNPDGSPVWATDQYGNIIYTTSVSPATNPNGSLVRQSVFAAPGNFAARQWGNGVLHPTILNSIVAESGYSDMRFGDDGHQGPPPDNDFEPVDGGVFATTGHPSDAPSASGYPN